MIIHRRKIYLRLAADLTDGRGGKAVLSEYRGSRLQYANSLFLIVPFL